MAKKGNNSEGQRDLIEYIEQVESLEAEIKTSRKHIKAVYQTATAAGRDPKAIKQIVRDRTRDMAKHAKHVATVKRYIKELGVFGETPLGEWAAATLATQRSADNARPPKALAAEAVAE